MPPIAPLALGLVALLTLAPPSNRDAEQRPTEHELRTMMNEHHRTVETYRDGRTADALTRLAEKPTWLNRVLADRVLAWMEDPKPQLKDSKDLPVKHWNARLVVALASLHMEAAHQAYVAKRIVEDYQAQAAIARLLFAYVARNRLGPSDLMARWTTAMGTLAVAEGQFWWALEILGDDCSQYKGSADFLVACGSAHETVSTLPAHILLGAGQSRDGGLPAMHVDSLGHAIGFRNRHLAAAERAYETALRVAPDGVEPRLRLARIQIVRGSAKRAFELLHPLTRTPAGDRRREAFLAHMLLGQARRAAGELEAAVVSFREAAALVPSAQSARVALAESLHRRGDISNAADTVAQVFEAPPKPPDPWGNYPYGQYWLPQTLFADLRAEARK